MRDLIFGLIGLTLCGGCMTAPPPAKSVALSGGAITATAPAGFCVDPASSNPRRGFAIIAPCATLGTDAPPPEVVGLATIQVGEQETAGVAGAEDALLSLLETDDGAALLSQTGDAAAIKVITTETQENTVTVHFTDKGQAPLNGLGTEEWRAFTDIDGRLVTVGVRALAQAPFPDGAGSWLLDLVVTGLVGQGQEDAEPAPDQTDIVSMSARRWHNLP